MVLTSLHWPVVGTKLKDIPLWGGPRRGIGMNLRKLVSCLPSHATKAGTVWPNGIQPDNEPLTVEVPPYIAVKPRRLAGRMRTGALRSGTEAKRLASNSPTTRAALHMPTIDANDTPPQSIFMNNESSRLR
jgi:hypothetical protein